MEIHIVTQRHQTQHHLKLRLITVQRKALLLLRLLETRHITMVHMRAILKGVLVLLLAHLRHYAHHSLLLHSQANPIGHTIRSTQ